MGLGVVATGAVEPRRDTGFQREADKLTCAQMEWPGGKWKGNTPHFHISGLITAPRCSAAGWGLEGKKATTSTSHSPTAQPPSRTAWLAAMWHHSPKQKESQALTSWLPGASGQDTRQASAFSSALQCFPEQSFWQTSSCWKGKTQFLFFISNSAVRMSHIKWKLLDKVSSGALHLPTQIA